MALNEMYQQHLAERSEGKLFEHIWMSYAAGTYYISKDYYTVVTGKVFLVNNNKEQESYDTLEDLNIQCHLIGNYDPNKTYERSHTQLTPEELKRHLNI